MASFLDRYYAQVNDNLDDPDTSVRLTKTQKYDLLRTVEQQLWERLLIISGHEATIGYAEKTITLVANQVFYPLPGNFRKFYRLERRQDGDPNRVLARLNSIPRFSYDVGVEILSAEKGFRLQPKPSILANEDWTLIYEKGPVQSFNTTITSVTNQATLGEVTVAAAPPADGGSFFALPDFYVSSLMRIYEGPGVGQVQECTFYDQVTRVFRFRQVWLPVLTTSSKIEIYPFLPEGLDAIYAIDASVLILTRRKMFAQRRELLNQRSELWNAVSNYFLTMVADRVPVRTLPAQLDGPDHGYEPSALQC